MIKYPICEEVYKKEETDSSDRLKYKVFSILYVICFFFILLSSKSYVLASNDILTDEEQKEILQGTTSYEEEFSVEIDYINPKSATFTLPQKGEVVFSSDPLASKWYLDGDDSNPFIVRNYYSVTLSEGVHTMTLEEQQGSFEYAKLKVKYFPEHKIYYWNGSKFKTLTTYYSYLSGSYELYKDDGTPISVPGYTVSGWYLDKNYTLPVSEVFYSEDKNIFLYPDLTSITYTINYDLDGGELSVPNPNNWKVDDGSVILSAPSKKYYSFKGWQLTNGRIVTSIDEDYMTRSDGHITLKALYSCDYPDYPTADSLSFNSAFKRKLDTKPVLVGSMISLNSIIDSDINSRYLFFESTNCEVASVYHDTLIITGAGMSTLTVESVNRKNDTVNISAVYSRKDGDSNAETYEVKSGNTISLGLEIGVCDNVEWYVENPKIAKIEIEQPETESYNDAGIFTSYCQILGKRAGTTKVIAMYKGEYHEWNICVFPPNLKYKNISIIQGQKKSNSVVGEYYNLKVVWKSDNNKIATISRYGTITAVKPGIVFMQADCNGNILRFKVKVSKCTTVKYKTVKLKVGKKKNNKIKYCAEKKKFKHKWISYNKRVATIDSNTGLITAKKQGQAIMGVKCDGYIIKFKVIVKK